ncbi:MAG: glutamate synthase subunit alpha, partial [Proteobacteria bacterium]|nr:glutamate synthase subunit alpha [Pseudomonadota bacterium]
LGAEEFGVATAALIVEGCVMLRKCHLNTCSVGIATQDPELRARFAGRVEHLVNFFLLLAEGVRPYMARLGFRTIDAMVGRVDRLRPLSRAEHWKAQKLDLAMLLAEPAAAANSPRCFAKARPWPLEDHIDHVILSRIGDALRTAHPVEVNLPIANCHRAAGALISGMIAREHGAKGLPRDTLQVRFRGSAGQSFGAFLAPGVTLELEGEANDYVGKGLSGGKLIIYPPRDCRFVPAENIIIGNTVLYGATSGELYAAGLAGERFAVRNSGARAVIEGVGDHGCEYMTGGVVVVLGRTGRNFAAGMSGGVAYVFDREQQFRKKCNLAMVELEELVDESAIWLVYGMIEDHVRYTGSAVGRRILDNWELMLTHFVRVMPRDYKRVLQARRAAQRPAQRPPQLAVVDGGLK